MKEKENCLFTTMMRVVFPQSLIFLMVGKRLMSISRYLVKSQNQLKLWDF